MAVLCSPPCGKYSAKYCSNSKKSWCEFRRVGWLSVPTPETCSCWRTFWNSLERFLNSFSVCSDVCPVASDNDAQKSVRFRACFLIYRYKKHVITRNCAIARKHLQSTVAIITCCIRCFLIFVVLRNHLYPGTCIRCSSDEQSQQTAHEVLHT